VPFAIGKGPGQCALKIAAALLIMAGGLFTSSPQSLALEGCTGVEPTSVFEALERARNVVLADVVSSELISAGDPSNPYRGDHKEANRLHLKVVEAFKGANATDLIAHDHLVATDECTQATLVPARAIFFLQEKTTGLVIDPIHSIGWWSDENDDYLAFLDFLRDIKRRDEEVAKSNMELMNRSEGEVPEWEAKRRKKDAAIK